VMSGDVGGVRSNIIEEDDWVGTGRALPYVTGGLISARSLPSVDNLPGHDCL